MNENTKSLIKKVERSVFAGNRAAAAGELGKTGDFDVVPVLLKALEDSSWKVKAAASEALGEIDDPDAVPGLTKMLEDSESSVKKAAIIALGKIGTPEAVSGIVKGFGDRINLYRENR
ncbi:HEAT repeat domain-containing protein [Methanosarcina horonobensis]|uniref:HEAT repeat domain-containing protein n=1 Tax=Methanosarcina horonobensis TaxID=418008 RepID=UPI0022B8F727|nr:HEAT repeat domain-containing protein [Methanosarcina horonobensis]